MGIEWMQCVTQLEEYERLAAEVNRDLEGLPLDARMREALSRCNGMANPIHLREALLGTAQAENKQ